MSAVVRYNVTPVDGLFATGLFVYVLQLTYRGTVSVRLVQVDHQSGTGPRDRDGLRQLTASAIVAGNPAEIADIKVYATNTL